MALNYTESFTRLIRFLQAPDLMVRIVARLRADPTLVPTPGYSKARATAIYGEAFRRCFEYLQGTRVKGDVVEFGTLQGSTARVIARLIMETCYPASLYLFDSFEGLPEISSPVDQCCYEVASNKVWWAGNMSVKEGTDVLIYRSLSKILPPSRLKVVKGFFEDTVDIHLPKTKIALAHIDCDLYSSAKYILEKLFSKDLLQDGCLLLFDDFNTNRANPQMGERRALAEVFSYQDRFHYSPWFSYGWHGQAFFVHDRQVPETSAKNQSAY